MLAIGVGDERLGRFRRRTSKEERSERKASIVAWLVDVGEDGRQSRASPSQPTSGMAGGGTVEATRCACDALSVTAWDVASF